MSQYVHSAIAGFRSLPKYLYVRANFNLCNNLLHLSCIVFALELSSGILLFPLTTCSLDYSTLSENECIDAKAKHCVSQLVHTATAFLHSPDFFAQLPHRPSVSFRLCSKFAKTFMNQTVLNTEI